MAKSNGSRGGKAFRKPGASNFFEIAGAWRDYPALILGGGPSLPAQWEALPKALRDRAIKISVNQHGCKLTPCDYVVAMDNIPEKLEEFDVPVLSSQTWADYRLTAFWDAGNSAQTAVWVAHELGCHPIVLLGIDCYQGGTYWHDEKAHSPANNTQLDAHFNSWRRVFTAVPMAVVRDAGGPLVKLFGQFDPDETLERKKEFEIDMDRVIGKLGRAKSNFAHRGNHYRIGQIDRFQHRDFQNLLNLGRIEEVDEDELRKRERPSEPVTKPRRASKRRGKSGIRDSRKPVRSD